MRRVHLSFSEKQHSGSVRIQNTAYDLEVLRCSLAPHMAELCVLILLILMVLMQSCCCCLALKEHRWVSGWISFFLAFHQMLKLVLLCLGLKTKPEEIDSTFLLFFFPPFYLSIGLVITHIITAQLDWKTSWSTSSRIQTAQGYLQKSFRGVTCCFILEEEVNQKPQPNEQPLLWWLRWPSCGSGAPAEGVSL